LDGQVNEPEITFADAFMAHLVWMWRLCITYPNEEIYVGDNDICGAFNHNKYNPMLVALHAFVLLGYLFMNTASTFGDNTSPSNFEPLARARQQHATYLWRTTPVGALAAQLPKYKIDVKMSPPPSLAERQQFSPAYADSIHHGVLDPAGNRLPPPFRHHVDDNLYADTAEFLVHTIAASVLALYAIFGEPDLLRGPDPLSREKFEAFHNYLRKSVGYMLDSRKMRVTILDHKRDQMLELLRLWLQSTTFTLQQIATLHGTFESLSRYCAWARPWFFAVQNAMRDILKQRYHYVKRRFNRHRRGQHLHDTMPKAFAHRISQLLDREQAQMLWNTRDQPFAITPPFRVALQTVFDHLSDRSNDWGQQIGHIIKRDPTFVSLGDASEDAGSGYCDVLRFWFQVDWSPAVRKLLRLPKNHPKKLPISLVEFTVIILQFAAVLARVRALESSGTGAEYIPGGIPSLPVLLARTDNTNAKSWVNRVTSSSIHAQSLIPIFAALLEHSPVGINADHIPGVENDEADYISRPDRTPLAFISAPRREQIFLQVPRMRSWDIFVPSQELCSLLTSTLCSGQCPARPVLPKSLGQFVPGDCTSYSLPAI
jgi:hypothetical protein